MTSSVSTFGQTNGEYTSINGVNSPIPYFHQLKKLPRVLGSAACISGALVALGLLSSQIATGEIEPTVSALETAAIGVALRSFQHINFNNEIALAINDVLSRWNLATFESLWQAYLNIENTLGKEVIAHFVCGLFGYSLANDFFNFISQKRGDRPEQLIDLSNLAKEKVNPGIGFTIDSPKKRFFLHGLITAIGVAAIAFGYQTDYLPQDMVTTAGYFLTLFGVSSSGAQIYLMKKRDELSRLSEYGQFYDHDQPAVILSEGEFSLPETRKQRFWRHIANGIQLVGPSAMLFSLFVNKHLRRPLKFDLSPFTFGLAGCISGVKTTLDQEELRTLPRAVHLSRQVKNLKETSDGRTVRSTALKVESFMTVIFAGLFILWFAYGIFASSTKERIGIALLMGSAYLSGLLTLVADTMFQPGKSNRIVNFLRYMTVENSFLLPLTSLYFTNTTQITDTALELSSDAQYIFGLMGLFMFGMFFGNVTALNISKTRPSPAFSSVASIFEMGMVFFMMLFGKKPSQLA